MEASGISSYITAAASSRGGAITVTATESGLPLGLSVDQEQWRRDPQTLANELLRLCRQAAAGARVAQRLELSAGGVSAEDLDQLGLPTADDAAAAELAAESEYEPRSLMLSSDE